MYRRDLTRIEIKLEDFQDFLQKPEINKNTVQQQQLISTIETGLESIAGTSLPSSSSSSSSSSLLAAALPNSTTTTTATNNVIHTNNTNNNSISSGTVGGPSSSNQGSINSSQSNRQARIGFTRR